MIICNTLHLKKLMMAKETISKIIIFAFILLLFSLIACSEQNNKIQELTFRIKEELLDSAYVDTTHNISFRPPRFFKSLSPDDLEQLVKSQENMASSAELKELKLTPIFAFADSSQKSYCFVSAIESHAYNDNESIIKIYKEKIKNKFINSNIKEGIYKIKDIIVHQLTLMDQNMVTIKLILNPEASDPIVVDYMMPLQIYRKNLRAVESSIGTIKQI